jgi:hypothetical protein
MLSKPFQHLFLIPCLLLLLGCTIRPVTAENRTDAAPVLTSTSFISHDGTELPLIIWQPEDETKFIFVALHGFNDYANFIKRGAQYFTRHNIAVYAYDQRGFGNGPVRGRWGGVEAMAEDLATLIRLIYDRGPSAKRGRGHPGSAGGMGAFHPAFLPELCPLGRRPYHALDRADRRFP